MARFFRFRDKSGSHALQDEMPDALPHEMQDALQDEVQNEMQDALQNALPRHDR